MELAAVNAIDMHVHLRDALSLQYRGERADQLGRYFGQAVHTVSIDEMADLYRDRRMMAVIMNSNNETVTGEHPVPNDHIAAAVEKHPDVFMGFGGIDPWQGARAVNEIRRCKDLGLVGIGELHPPSQQFYPNDVRFYPLWAEAERLAMPVLFHSGMAGSGAGTPGGSGIKLKYGRPIYLDDVAADFPGLKVVSAHPGWPWQDESLAMALHKENLYLDLSGWAPKYFPSQLVHYANTLLQDKVMFGSDWPVVPLDRWLGEFEHLGLKQEVRTKILRTNAVRLLGLQ